MQRAACNTHMQRTACDVQRATCTAMGLAAGIAMPRAGDQLLVGNRGGHADALGVALAHLRHAARSARHMTACRHTLCGISSTPAKHTHARAHTHTHVPAQHTPTHTQAHAGVALAALRAAAAGAPSPLRGAALPTARHSRQGALPSASARVLLSTPILPLGTP
jgi:hypothetical protein